MNERLQRIQAAAQKKAEARVCIVMLTSLEQYSVTQSVHLARAYMQYNLPYKLSLREMSFPLILAPASHRRLRFFSATFLSILESYKFSTSSSFSHLRLTSAFTAEKNPKQTCSLGGRWLMVKRVTIDLWGCRMRKVIVAEELRYMACGPDASTVFNIL